jgi:hypothetical protein
MNILLCIGCDAYDNLPPLHGAERDARSVFDLLTGHQKDYPSDCSRLLLSPSASLIMESLNELLAVSESADVVTFFFAGHGAVKAGSFYLCTREAHAERLSMTGYAITGLFQVVNELRPRQVNIIIDACEAGGSSFDLGGLCKQETIGQSSSSSIAFLGACGADEYASETSAGGVLTTELIKCLTGHHHLQADTEALALIDVGTFLSSEIHTNHPKQKPIVWGLSLFGKGFFATNPHFSHSATERPFRVQNITPRSALGQKISQFSSQLWDEYRSINRDPSPRRLFELLDAVCRDCGEVSGNTVVIQGLAETLSARARASTEALAASQCIATSAVCLLPDVDNGEVGLCLQELLRMMTTEDRRVRKVLQHEIACKDRALLSAIGVAAELYYLPLRLTRLLGLLGSTIILGHLFRDETIDDTESCIQLARILLEKYSGAFVSVSDDQAASLYVFVHACLLVEETVLAKDIVNRYFGSFAEKRGNVARTGTDGKQAFRYVASLTHSDFSPSDWRPANPSYFLPVLMIAGAKLGLTEDWSLEALDRQSTAFFFPHDYRHFGRKVIAEGKNYTHKIGFGVWHISEYMREFVTAFDSHFTEHPLILSREGVAVSIVASQLFPDRVPFVLERLTATADGRS